MTNKPSRLATNVIGLWSCVFRWTLAVWQPGCWKTWHHWRSTLLVCLPSMTKDKLRLWQTASPQVRNYHRDCYIHKYFWNVSTRIVGVCLETVPDPVDLRSSDISTNSFRVSWAHPASDVVLYRLTWTPTDGEESNEVFMGFLYAYMWF